MHIVCIFDTTEQVSISAFHYLCLYTVAAMYGAGNFESFDGTSHTHSDDGDFIVFKTDTGVEIQARLKKGIVFIFIINDTLLSCDVCFLILLLARLYCRAS